MIDWNHELFIHRTSKHVGICFNNIAWIGWSLDSFLLHIATLCLKLQLIVEEFNEPLLI